MNWPTLDGWESIAIIAAAFGSGALNVYQLVKARRPKVKPLRLDLELLPLHYVVSVGPGMIQTVQVLLRVINYTNNRLEPSEIRVRYLQIEGAQSLDNITATDPPPVEAKQSRDIYCRRPLIGEEVTQLRQVALSPRGGGEGSVTLVGRGVAGRRRVSYDSGSFVVRGKIEGVEGAP